MEKSESPTLATPATTHQRTGVVTIRREKPVVDILEQRLQIFQQQELAVNYFYNHLLSEPDSSHNSSDQSYTLFYLNERKHRFVESKKLMTAFHLNARDVASLQQLQVLFDNLHIVDDLLLEVVHQMPSQRPVGWQLMSMGQNLLNLPTTIPVRQPTDARKIEQSLASTILQFFGVGCYSIDKGYFIGHILGYLFCCYYFAHLSISYSVTPLKETIVNRYPYQYLEVPQLVRLLQETDGVLKAKVYQLAVYAAQLSDYAIDKRIEKMLICEVNSFNKQDYRDELASFVSCHESEKATLFQPVKPLK